MNSTLDVISEDPVLGQEVFVTLEQFLVNRAGNVAQQLLPMHCGVDPWRLPLSITASLTT